MDVSIIIVSWNTREILRDCLRSVLPESPSLRQEVIVVDNASSDGSAEMVRRDFPQVRLIANGENRGFAAANNQAIAVSSGRYILLLNSDTVVLDRAVEKTIAFADENPRAAVVGCRVLNPDHTLQPTCFMFPSVLNKFLSAFGLYKLFPRSRFFGREQMTWWSRDDVRPVDVVTGCFMLVRRCAIDQVGLLDEAYYVYGEETDWCARFAAAGWQTLFTPEPQIIHLGGASSKQRKAPMLLQLKGSLLLFMKKHRSRPAYILSCLLVSLFFALRLPLWTAKAILSRSGNHWLRARVCLSGAFRALGGTAKLCLRPPASAARIDFLCFGGEDWWYHNRGHIDFQLMRRFSRLGRTLYVNSIVMQKPSISPGSRFFLRLRRKTASILRGLRKGDGGFWVYSPLSFPFHQYRWARAFNRFLVRSQVRLAVRRLGLRDPIIWVACPPAADIALATRRSRLIYQRTDCYEQYPNVDAGAVIEYDRRLKSSADLTVMVNEQLYRRERSQCRDAVYLDHGVDYDLFAAEPSEPPPPELRGIQGPIVGFFGGIDDHTMDVPFISEVVRILPAMNFVFVGKASADCSTLAFPNVHMLGPRPYEQIPAYGRCFDVAIMPWRRNDWINACNPIKLKEYLALGKPIVSTPFSELKRYSDVVYIARTPEEFADCIRTAIDEDNSIRISQRRDAVRDASWDAKATAILAKLAEIEPVAHEEHDNAEAA